MNPAPPVTRTRILFCLGRLQFVVLQFRKKRWIHPKAEPPLHQHVMRFREYLYPVFIDNPDSHMSEHLGKILFGEFENVALYLRPTIWAAIDARTWDPRYGKV